jgi:hypothetical protein
MEPMEGFTIRYGYPGHYESAPQGTPKYRADRRLMFIKVHAGSTLGTGSYFLKGTVVFHRAGDDASAEQTTDIHIPVTVVDHDAPVSQNDWRYINHPARATGEVARTVLLVALLPLLPFYALMMCGNLTCHD